MLQQQQQMQMGGAMMPMQQMPAPAGGGGGGRGGRRRAGAPESTAMVAVQQNRDMSYEEKTSLSGAINRLASNANSNGTKTQRYACPPRAPTGALSTSLRLQESVEGVCRARTSSPRSPLLHRLNSANLDRVVKIIQENMPNVGNDDNPEIEIDINSLDRVTLWALGVRTRARTTAGGARPTPSPPLYLPASLPRQPSSTRARRRRRS